MLADRFDPDFFVALAGASAVLGGIVNSILRVQIGRLDPSRDPQKFWICNGIFLAPLRINMLVVVAGLLALIVAAGMHVLA